VRNAAIAVSIALLVLAGCDKEANQPTSEEFQQERAALNARVEARKANKPARQAAPAAAPSQIAAVPAGTPISESFSGTGSATVYDKTDLRDPFRSFEWERKELASEDMDGGPLEQFDVSQLSVVAVVWSTGNARAMIQDPSGRGHIVGVGAPVGKNEGSITSIDDNLVVVKETYEDYLGQVTKKDIEMRIRRPDKGGVNVGVY
jgi:Tfp pilus assembly protein PilP